jgi:hypothetical protein
LPISSITHYQISRLPDYVTRLPDYKIPPVAPDYCRDLETYLCQKNDGHLIRIVGPSFDMVSRWAADGVPLKVAQRGIDRYFERYYRKGPRRRPVRIEFCEADVLDAFDEWRRATGLTAADGDADRASRQPSLPAHIERVLLRLTNGRAKGVLGPAADPLIDRVAQELDRARATSGGVRGEPRRALVARLAALDTELVELTRALVDPADRRAFEKQAELELAPFRASMPEDGYRRALTALVDRLVREQLDLPTISF